MNCGLSISAGAVTVAEAAQNLVDQFSSLVQGVREYAEETAANGLAGGGDTVRHRPPMLAEGVSGACRAAR